MGDGAVAMARLALGGEHGLVDVHGAPGVAGEGGEQALQRRGLVPAHQRRGGDGARVDHRVQRPARAGLQADGVEGLAGGLDAHLGQHRVEPAVLQREPVGDGLGDGLHRKRPARFADLVDMPVHGGQRDAEPRRVGAGQLRDVVREGAVGERRQRRVQVFQVVLQRRRGERTGQAGAPPPRRRVLTAPRQPRSSSTRRSSTAALARDM
jgi:hypothetical protein